nr:interferon stimulated 20 kDa exonuclease [Hymenolepis microstoma]
MELLDLKKDASSGPIAIDCEVVSVGADKINALGRVSIVDYNGNVLYDAFSRPDEPISDYHTPYSGIRPHGVENALPFKVVRNVVMQIIRNHIVVGHSIINDLRVLKLKHPRPLIRDTNTAPYAKIAAKLNRKRLVPLRELYYDLFGEKIQQGKHCSVEDARATMKIYRRVEQVWEADLKFRFPENYTKEHTPVNHDGSEEKLIRGDSYHRQAFLGEQLLTGDMLPNFPIALDCEMVGVGRYNRNALGRVSIVDYHGNIFYDAFSRPDKPVTNYRTQFSGIRPIDLVNAPPLKVVRQHVMRIIKNRVVVGHAIWNDFEVLRLNHPHYLIRDTCTAPYPRVRIGRGKKGLVALRDLFFDFFGKEIQQGEHSSVEDARATMAIYHQVEQEWEADLKGNALEGNNGGLTNKIFPIRKKSSKSSGCSWWSAVGIIVLCLYFIVMHYATG